MLRKFSKDLKRGFQVAKIVQRKYFALLVQKKIAKFCLPIINTFLSRTV